MPKSSGKNLHKRVKYSKILIWIFVLIIAIAFLVAAINFSYKKIGKDSLLLKCIYSFNECRDENLNKNGISLILLDKNKFQSAEKAEQFFEKWKSSLLQENFEDEVKDAEYPLVLLATSIEKGAVKINFVVVCENSGEIADWMKKQLSC